MTLDAFLAESQERIRNPNAWTQGRLASSSSAPDVAMTPAGALVDRWCMDGACLRTLADHADAGHDLYREAISFLALAAQERVGLSAEMRREINRCIEIYGPGDFPERITVEVANDFGTHDVVMRTFAAARELAAAERRER